MFGFSIAKLLFTIIAVLAVWHGFKWFTRIQQVRTDNQSRVGKRGNPAGYAPSARAGDFSTDAEEMIKCTVCDTYVSAGSAVSCGRDGCPYPG